MRDVKNLKPVKQDIASGLDHTFSMFLAYQLTSSSLQNTINISGPFLHALIQCSTKYKRRASFWQRYDINFSPLYSFSNHWHSPSLPTSDRSNSLLPTNSSFVLQRVFYRRWATYTQNRSTNKCWKHLHEAVQTRKNSITYEYTYSVLAFVVHLRFTGRKYFNCPISFILKHATMLIPCYGVFFSAAQLKTITQQGRQVLANHIAILCSSIVEIALNGDRAQIISIVTWKEIKWIMVLQWVITLEIPSYTCKTITPFQPLWRKAGHCLSQHPQFPNWGQSSKRIGTLRIVKTSKYSLEKSFNCTRRIALWSKSL